MIFKMIVCTYGKKTLVISKSQIFVDQLSDFSKPEVKYIYMFFSKPQNELKFTHLNWCMRQSQTDTLKMSTHPPPTLPFYTILIFYALSNILSS